MRRAWGGAMITAWHRVPPSPIVGRLSVSLRRSPRPSHPCSGRATRAGTLLDVAPDVGQLRGRRQVRNIQPPLFQELAEAVQGLPDAIFERREWHRAEIPLQG